MEAPLGRNLPVGAAGGGSWCPFLVLAETQLSDSWRQVESGGGLASALVQAGVERWLPPSFMIPK